MKKLKMPIACAGLAMALAAPTAVAQQESGATISANVTLASDYSFRGWSQTQRDPAIQGGFDIGHESGFYVGTWGSNVNFGANDEGQVASMEWDLYAGWGGDLTDDVSFDASFIHYEYPGDRDGLNYQEVQASVSFADFTVGLYYSPEYLAVDDVTFLYPYVDYSLGIAESLSVDFHLGLNQADSPGGDFFGEDDEYIDYSISLGMPVFGVDGAIGVYGTDNDACGRDCDLRLILSLSKSL